MLEKGKWISYGVARSIKNWWNQVKPRLIPEGKKKNQTGGCSLDWWGWSLCEIAGQAGSVKKEGETRRRSRTWAVLLSVGVAAAERGVLPFWARSSPRLVPLKQHNAIWLVNNTGCRRYYRQPRFANSFCHAVNYCVLFSSVTTSLDVCSICRPINK